MLSSHPGTVIGMLHPGPSTTAFVPYEPWHPLLNFIFRYLPVDPIGVQCCGDNPSIEKRR